MDLVGLLPDIKKYKLLRMLEDWRQGQSRIEYREPCMLSVDIATPERVYRDFICNLSSRGAFIETREAFVRGQDVLLTFSSPDEKKHYRVKGMVVRTDVKGIAVKFKHKIKKNNLKPPRDKQAALIQIVK